MDSSYGIASVKCGTRDLGRIQYRIQVGAGGQINVLKFDQLPNAKDGETLHLVLEDGRMIDCQVIDSSPYCAVVGEGPYFDRRTSQR